MELREMKYSVLLGIGSLIVILSFILYPGEVFHSSLRGLLIWWEVVFPSTLPFFVVSEMLMGFGVAHFFGILLEPVMRPLFRVPGAGSFVLTMGFASGYPMSAKLTVRLREKGMITQAEGERLVAFTTTSDPLFIFGAVAVGFFHKPEIGLFLAAVHYGTALIVGILLRFFPLDEKPTPPPAQNGGFLLIRALQAMNRARAEDGRPFGKLLSDAVSSSIQTLLLIGGLIMIFSVFMKVLERISLNLLIEGGFQTLLSLFHLPLGFSDALMNGLFEVTLGVKEAALGNGGTLIHAVGIASAILAWGGLSVHAQIASILSSTDLSYRPLLFARFLHVILATAGSYLFFRFLPALGEKALPSFAGDPYLLQNAWWPTLTASVEMIFILLTLFLLLITIFFLSARLIKKRG